MKSHENMPSEQLGEQPEATKGQQQDSTKTLREQYFELKSEIDDLSNNRSRNQEDAGGRRLKVEQITDKTKLVSRKNFNEALLSKIQQFLSRREEFQADDWYCNRLTDLLTEIQEEQPLIDQRIAEAFSQEALQGQGSALWDEIKSLNNRRERDVLKKVADREMLIKRMNLNEELLNKITQSLSGYEKLKELGSLTEEDDKKISELETLTVQLRNEQEMISSKIADVSFVPQVEEHLRGEANEKNRVYEKEKLFQELRNAVSAKMDALLSKVHDIYRQIKTAQQVSKDSDNQDASTKQALAGATDKFFPKSDKGKSVEQEQFILELQQMMDACDNSDPEAMRTEFKNKLKSWKSEHGLFSKEHRAASHILKSDNEFNLLVDNHAAKQVFQSSSKQLDNHKTALQNLLDSKLQEILQDAAEVWKNKSKNLVDRNGEINREYGQNLIKLLDNAGQGNTKINFYQQLHKHDYPNSYYYGNDMFWDILENSKKQLLQNLEKEIKQ